MSKKLFSFFITIMILINFSSSVVFSEPAVPKRMLVLGDSISTGYGLEGYAENKANGYAQRLKSAFNIKDADYLNLARDGLDSSQLLEFIKKPENKDLFKNYDSIFITIGGNDILNRIVSEIDDFYNYLPESLDGDIESVLDNLKKSADKMAAHLNEEKVKQGSQNQ
ncbi:MAG TPA: GDSL-type esterase/lipase family protein, partial [Oscillospiraceae bacterium]|nr:GDSL-type esterase/lipase family protein [Oscillospiraceae bacterium]